MIQRQQMPTRAPALFLLLGIILGLLLARESEAPTRLALLIGLSLATISLILARRFKTFWLISFIGATTLTFWAYGDLRLPDTPEKSLLERPIREATIEMEVDRVMRVSSPFGNASGVAQVLSADPMSRVQPGDRLFFRIDLRSSTEGLSSLRGSHLRATGLLTPIPETVAPDSFERYLKDLGIHYQFTRTRALERLRPPPAFDRFCQKMNLRFQDYLRLGAPADGGVENIYIAMLLGEKAELSDVQAERFRASGTMHFFAISGLHIGVIATVIAQFLVLIRMPRRVRPFIGLPLLYLYVEITGAPPSAVRAFLMALFFWLSFAFTRQRSPLAALAASAVFVLILSPEQLWSLGFQLSYTVVLSILLLGLPLHQAAATYLAPFKALPEANWGTWQRLYAPTQNGLLLLLAISLSAWLASAPLSAAHFGYVSPGAILLNMLLVNLAALSISAGIISLALATLGAEALAGFINHSAWLTISCMDWLVAASVQIPGMFVRCELFPKPIAHGSLTIYFGMLIWIHRTPIARSPYWLLAPSLIIIAGLLLGLGLSGE